jgi:hypothetical protein
MRLPSRRWWLWSAVAFLLAGLLSTALFSISFGLSNRDRVTMSHIGRLKLGMQQSEVRRILGDNSTPIPCADGWKEADPSWSASEWKGKCLGVRILFDSNGRLRDWTAFITDGKFEWTDRVVNWMDWMGL